MDGNLSPFLDGHDAWSETWNATSPQLPEHMSFGDIEPEQPPTSDNNFEPIQDYGDPAIFPDIDGWPISPTSPSLIPAIYNTRIFAPPPVEPWETGPFEPQTDQDDTLWSMLLRTPSNEGGKATSTISDLYDEELKGWQSPTDEEEMNDTDPEWTGELNSAQDARNFLASLEEPLQIPNIKNDDAEDVRHNQMPIFGAAVLQAIAHAPAPPPDGMSATQESYYLKQQNDTMKKVQERLLTHTDRKIAESRALLLLDTAVDCHLVGLPRKDFELEIREKGGHRSATELSCGERIAKIMSCLKQNKIASLDVLEGKGFVHLARNPDHFLFRKIANVKSNGKKKQKHDEAAQEPDLDPFDQEAPQVEQNSEVVSKPKASKKAQGKKPKRKQTTREKHESKIMLFTQVTKLNVPKVTQENVDLVAERSSHPELSTSTSNEERGLGITAHGQQFPAMTSGFGTAVLEDEPNIQQQPPKLFTYGSGMLEDQLFTQVMKRKASEMEAKDGNPSLDERAVRPRLDSPLLKDESSFGGMTFNEPFYGLPSAFGKTQPESVSEAEPEGRWFLDDGEIHKEDGNGER